jgi:hypothetical protein
MTTRAHLLDANHRIWCGASIDALNGGVETYEHHAWDVFVAQEHRCVRCEVRARMPRLAHALQRLLDSGERALAPFNEVLSG